MLNILSHKTKQFFFVLIKTSIVICVFYFIYQKLFISGNLIFSDFSAFLIKNSVFSSKNIILLLFLTVFNWFFEILKWQNLVTFIKSISFFEAFKQTLAAHTVAILTPNRVGDYGAKALYHDKTYRKKIILLNGLGNSAQLIITILLGSIGFILFNLKYRLPIFSNTVFIGISLTFIFIIGLWGVLKIKNRFTKKVIKSLKQISLKIYLKTILFSGIRYGIFSFQYYFILLLFGIEINYIDAMIIVTTMYLISSVIPTIFVFDALVKGSVAIYLFSVLTISEIAILSTAMLMWLLNFVLPTLIGSIFVLTFKPNLSPTNIEIQY